VLRHVLLLELGFSNLFPRFLIITGMLAVDTNTQNKEEAIERKLHAIRKPVISAVSPGRFQDRTTRVENRTDHARKRGRLGEGGF
jgi:hypothetical protein